MLYAVKYAYDVGGPFDAVDGHVCLQYCAEEGNVGAVGAYVAR